jgi:hypothetical protein
MSVSVVDAPDVVNGAVAMHTLVPTLQLNAPAAQGPATTAVAQVAEVAVLQAPLVHEKVAAPVVGDSVSFNTVEPPEAVEPTAASQVLPPTVQLKEPAAQGAGDVQLALVAAPHVPFVHAKLAAPVVGADRSDRVVLWPDTVAGATASQILPPTVQLSAPAAQGAGVVHVAEVGTPHAPLVHEKVATPVAGAIESVSTVAAPEAVDGADALQALPPTLQLSEPAAQGAGALQVAEVAALQAPLVHEKVAAPVVGDSVSFNTVEPPEAIEPTAASQLLPPTVQLKEPAAQGAGDVQLALVAAPHAPLVQAKLAAPVVGADRSDRVALWPDTVTGATASQILPPTVQLSAPAAQSKGGATATLQVATGDASFVQVPPTHWKAEVPVVGARLSTSEATVPEAAVLTEALQVLRPTVQLSVLVAQAVVAAVMGLPHHTASKYAAMSSLSACGMELNLHMPLSNGQSASTALSWAKFAPVADVTP